MKSQSKYMGSSLAHSNEYGQFSLKRTDKAVLKYLDEMTQPSDGETCRASIPKIASACKISKRQVQISTKRLIEAGLIERLGYDFGNPDRTQRGTIYKLLIRQAEMKHSTEGRRKSIKLLLLWSED
jgi:DNA-binding MarR family transcriptional regulator